MCRTLRGFAWITWVTLVVGPAFSQTLREAADRSQIRVGAAARPEQLAEPAYAARAALLFDREYRPEPAYDALRRVLEQANRR